jgi:hypothetical protein
MSVVDVIKEGERKCTAMTTRVFGHGKLAVSYAASGESALGGLAIVLAGFSGTGTWMLCNGLSHVDGESAVVVEYECRIRMDDGEEVHEDYEQVRNW